MELIENPGLLLFLIPKPFHSPFKNPFVSTFLASNHLDLDRQISDMFLHAAQR